MDFHQQYTILSKKRVRYYLCRRQPRTSEPPLTIVQRGHQLSLSACEVFQVKEKMEWNSILSRAANTHTASSCTR
ncbi:hypothetical protein QC762_117618 [Podospora pseudocomata]|uniref:Uncharacterized protein n=1 Tax=Podospora pseudocomata TaxID=2093779 RepID=A0ABR0GWX1_9PEZI|nr:hypothetical protein QC762_117618 [Podospora pseudocomata]